jgi:HlyD family secretion protein
MKIPRKRLLLLVSFLVLAALGALALRPSVAEVETAAAVRGPLRVTIDEDGETRVHHRYTLSAPAAGRLERIGLHVGDPVEPGDVVARIAPLPLDPRGREQAAARLRSAQAAEREADAQAGRARAALDEARRTLARKERLAAEDLVPADEIDAARTAVRTLETELDAARHRTEAAAFDVQNARAALHEGLSSPSGVIELRSPVRGQVLKVCEECERVVQPGSQLLELGDPAALEAVVDVLSSDAVHIRPGTPVLLRAGEDEEEPELQARVRVVEPVGFTKVSPLGVEEQRVNVVADLIDPPGALGDRYRVESRIVLWESPAVLKVPSGALFRSGDRWSVFRVEDGRARLREVRLGHRNPSEAEILSGLRESDKVVLHPGDQIKEGVRVR